MPGRFLSFLLLCLPSLVGAASIQLRVIQTIAYPGANQTVADDVNDSGQVVGTYFAGPMRQAHAFVVTGSNYLTIDPPGAVSSFATGINDRGQIVGFYSTSDRKEHGFVYDNGLFSSVSTPGHPDWLEAHDIDEQGDIAGFDGGSAGFVLTAGGNYTTITHESRGDFTGAWGVSDTGIVIGSTLIDPHIGSISWLKDASGFTDVPDLAFSDINSSNEILAVDVSQKNYLYKNRLRTPVELPAAFGSAALNGFDDRGHLFVGDDFLASSANAVPEPANFTPAGVVLLAIIALHLRRQPMR